ncbi:MAG: hypothetical protein ACRDS0_27610 [Pseudonocardiaceae bacterium]
MTNQLASSQAPTSHRAEDTGLEIRSIAELVATTMCGLYRLHGQFVRVNATLGDDGYINVEVTRMFFDREDTTMRVLLYPTSPEPASSSSVPGPRSVA